MHDTSNACLDSVKSAGCLAWRDRLSQRNDVIFRYNARKNYIICHETGKFYACRQVDASKNANINESKRTIKSNGPEVLS
jgi:hypothetical protein